MVSTSQSHPPKLIWRHGLGMYQAKGRSYVRGVANEYSYARLRIIKPLVVLILELLANPSLSYSTAVDRCCRVALVRVLHPAA